MKVVKKYRKKPVIVTAYQCTKDEIIPTLEGDMKATAGDFIVTGVKGERYPCKPDIFIKLMKKLKKMSKNQNQLEDN